MKTKVERLMEIQDMFPKVITECPHCGGGLRETYSSEIGFCPKCMRQVRLIDKGKIGVKK